MRIAAWLTACATLLLMATAGPSAAQTTDQSGWLPGPGAGPANPYKGFVDSPSAGGPVPSSGTFAVGGWFVDTSAQGWAGADNVQVFLGQMGNGGTMLAQGVVGGSRPDVAGALGNPYWSASGFLVQVPASSLAAGNQTLEIYLHTPSNGWWYQSLTVNVGAATVFAATPVIRVPSGLPQVTITSPSENQTISTRKGDFTIMGTATEPGIGPSDIDRVEVWLDGERGDGTLLGTLFPADDGSWFVSFTPTHFGSTHSNIYVYAHSTRLERETETIRGFNIVDQ